MAGLTDKRFFSLRSHLYYNLIILATALVVFLCVPPFILEPPEANTIFNNGMIAQVIAGLVLFIAVFYAVGAILYWTLSLVKLKPVAAFGATFSFCWVALSAFLFPLTRANGTFTLVEGPTNQVNLLIVLALSIVFTVLWLSKHSTTIAISISAFVLIAVTPAIPKMFSEFDDTTALAGIRLSTEKNVIAISFDGIPGHKLKTALENDPVLKGQFKDFTLFENVASSSLSTGVSIMGIMLGNHDFTKIDRRAFVNAQDLYFHNNNYFDTYTNFAYNQYNPNGTKFSSAHFGAKSQFRKLFNLYKNVTLRLTTKRGVQLVEKLEKRLFNNIIWRLEESLSAYDDILGRLENGNDIPGILYMHFGFTHFPIAINEDCNLNDANWDWINANQSEDALDRMAICAAKKYGQLLEKLQSLGVYENSLIILNSDHGYPSTYYKSPPNNLKINGHAFWGFDRYQPLLMIKGAGVSQGEIEYSQINVILDDIAQTACYAVTESSKCEDRPGLNLLDEMDVPPKNFYIHVVKDEASTWNIDTHKAVKLPRNIRLIDAMQASDEIEFSNPINDMSSTKPRIND